MKPYGICISVVTRVENPMPLIMMVPKFETPPGVATVSTGCIIGKADVRTVGEVGNDSKKVEQVQFWLKEHFASLIPFEGFVLNLYQRSANIQLVVAMYLSKRTPVWSSRKRSTAIRFSRVVRPFAVTGLSGRKMYMTMPHVQQNAPIMRNSNFQDGRPPLILPIPNCYTLLAMALELPITWNSYPEQPAHGNTKPVGRIPETDSDGLLTSCIPHGCHKNKRGVGTRLCGSRKSSKSCQPRKVIHRRLQHEQRAPEEDVETEIPTDRKTLE